MTNIQHDPDANSTLAIGNFRWFKASQGIKERERERRRQLPRHVRREWVTICDHVSGGDERIMSWRQVCVCVCVCVRVAVKSSQL